MSEVDSFVALRNRARDKVANLQLPPPDELNGHGGAGSGRTCCICELEIPKYRTEKPTLEYAVQWRKAERAEVLRFHSDCFRAWVSLSVLDARHRPDSTSSWRAARPDMRRTLKPRRDTAILSCE